MLRERPSSELDPVGNGLKKRNERVSKVALSFHAGEDRLSRVSARKERRYEETPDPAHQQEAKAKPILEDVPGKDKRFLNRPDSTCREKEDERNAYWFRFVAPPAAVSTKSTASLSK